MVSCGSVGASSFDATTGDPVTTNFTLNAGGFIEADPDLTESYVPQAAEASLAAPIDWTAVLGTYPESTAIPDYLDATDYLGAVDPDATSLWFEGWTIEGSL